MPAIERIREKVRQRDYYLSSHAEDEMAEEGFGRTDAEHALLHGFIITVYEKGDPDEMRVL